MWHDKYSNFKTMLQKQKNFKFILYFSNPVWSCLKFHELILYLCWQDYTVAQQLCKLLKYNI